jgi:hypothetical protein
MSQRYKVEECQTIIDTHAVVSPDGWEDWVIEVVTDDQANLICEALNAIEATGMKKLFGVYLCEDIYSQFQSLN